MEDKTNWTIATCLALFMPSKVDCLLFFQSMARDHASKASGFKAEGSNICMEIIDCTWHGVLNCCQRLHLTSDRDNAAPLDIGLQPPIHFEDIFCNQQLIYAWFDKKGNIISVA